MKMNTPNDLFNQPAFRSLAPAKQQIIIEFVNETNGLPMEKAISVLGRTNLKMKALGLSFTKQESELMTQILTASLAPAERDRINAILKMMPH